jgi:hypothetical protein
MVYSQSRKLTYAFNNQQDSKTPILEKPKGFDKMKKIYVLGPLMGKLCNYLVHKRKVELTMEGD